MAKEKEETGLAVKPVTAMATAMERPAFLSVNDTRGTENITKDDLQMPRLALAQKMSEEVDAELKTPKFIEGLRIGEFFNSLSKMNYGRGPLHFTVIRSDRPRYIEFIPRTQGGGIKDFNVPANDPRTEFTKNEKGESVPPLATKFYDYVIMLTDPQYNNELIALSLKSTGLKTARLLNGLMKTRNAPSFAGNYVLTSGSETNKKGTYAVYKVDNAKPTPEKPQFNWVTPEQFKYAEQVYEGLKGKTITIDREPGDEDFNPETLDHPPTDGAAGTM